MQVGTVSLHKWDLPFDLSLIEVSRCLRDLKVTSLKPSVALRRKMGIIAKGLLANPTVVDLDLSSNFLSDGGVREVAKVVKAPNSVLGMLNLARNHITAQGTDVTNYLVLVNHL
jgi:hypothetical protein